MIKIIDSVSSTQRRALLSHFEVQLSWFLHVSFSKPLPLTLFTRQVFKQQLSHVGKSVFSLPPGCTPHCLSPVSFKSPFPSLLSCHPLLN